MIKQKNSKNRLKAVSKSDNFFSSSHVYPTVWSAIFGLISFGLGVLYKDYTGPDVVKLDSDSTKEQPLNVNILKSSLEDSGPRREDIADLTLAIKALNNSSTKPDSASEIKSLENSIKKIQIAFEKSEKEKDEISKTLNSDSRTGSTGELEKSVNAWSQINEESLNRKDEKPVESQQQAPNIFFNLPTSAKGYSPEKMKGVKNAYCPPRELQIGTPIVVGFNLTDEKLIVNASPLIFSLNRINGPLSLTQVEEVQVPILKGINSHATSIKLVPGEYEVSYGYFLKNNLTGEYPPFYTQICKVSIRPVGGH